MQALRLPVSLPAVPATGYEVVLGDGILASELVAASRETAGGPCAIIGDDTVLGLYVVAASEGLHADGVEVFRLGFPPGEPSKSRETIARLQDEAIAAGLGRDGWVVALGGGVAGDVAGFVAATLLRGLPYVQVPTTLLAMVDSSVGGKTGIDTPAGKNLVGAFHQPRGVIADVATLATLPDAELRAGLAEVIKYGVILDEQLFIDLEDGLLESCLAGVPEALADIVARCVRWKAAIVAEDEREEGRRQILNFGHTVAHALERASGYGLRHGEAVAVGMVIEARLAERHGGAAAGLSERVADLCGRAGLPTRVPGEIDAEVALEAARRDKKARRGRIRCALPRAVGEMARAGDEWTHPVETEHLRALLTS